MSESSQPIEPYSIRRAGPNDIEQIVAHRRDLIRELRKCDESVLDIMSNQFRTWVEKKIDTDEYIELFVVANDNSIAGGLGLWIIDWPPYILPTGVPANKRAYMLNVYTEPVHRRNGFACLLVQTSSEWCVKNGMKMIILHASPMGRPLYESLGFAAGNEMRRVLE